jgi:hypothetical protein
MNSSSSNVRLPYNLNTKDGLTNFLKYIRGLNNLTNLSKFNSLNKQQDFNLIKSKIEMFINLIIKSPNSFSEFIPFYIYDLQESQIICIGILSDKRNNNNNKKYKQLVFILSIPNTIRSAGKIAIYKIGDKLKHNYNGIYVGTIPSAVSYYKKFNHRQISNNTFILSKNQPKNNSYNQDRFILVEKNE